MKVRIRIISVHLAWTTERQCTFEKRTFVHSVECESPIDPGIEKFGYLVELEKKRDGATYNYRIYYIDGRYYEVSRHIAATIDEWKDSEISCKLKRRIKAAVDKYLKGLANG